MHSLYGSHPFHTVLQLLCIRCFFRLDPSGSFGPLLCSKSAECVEAFTRSEAVEELGLFKIAQAHQKHRPQKMCRGWFLTQVRALDLAACKSVWKEILSQWVHEMWRRHKWRELWCMKASAAWWMLRYGLKRSLLVWKRTSHATGCMWGAFHFCIELIGGLFYCFF